MRGSRVTYLVHGGDDGVEGGVVANGQVGTVEVIVDRPREANDGDVKLFGELPCARERAIASDDDQSINAVGAHRLVCQGTSFGSAELGATGGLEDCPPTLDDVAHVLGLKVLYFTCDQAFVSTVNTFDADAVVDSCSGDGADGSVHPWGIATRGEHPYTFDCSHILCVYTKLYCVILNAHKGTLIVPAPHSL